MDIMHCWDKRDMQCKEGISLRRRCIGVILALILVILLQQIAFGEELVINYKIQKGDTLSGIAARFNTTIHALVVLNKISDVNYIRVGQVLKIATEEVIKRFTVYTIKQGDTIDKICKMFEISLEEICSLNGIDDPNKIVAGEDLILPVRNDVIAARAGNVQTIATLGSLSDELWLLSKIIYAEARGEPFEGQVAVGAVVMNRVKDYRFPNTITEVIYEPGQFRPASDGTINLTPNQSAIRAAKSALSGMDPTGGALFFYNPKIASTAWWFENRPVTRVIGNHVFTK